MNALNPNDVLLAVEKLDGDLYRLESSRASLAATVHRAEQALAAASARLHEASATLQKLELEERAIELRLKELDIEFHRMESAAESAHNAAQFSAAQEALAHKQTARSDLESKGLELLDRLEAARVGKETAGKQHNEAQSRLAHSVEALGAFDRANREAMQSVSGRVTGLLNGLSPGLQTRYSNALDTAGRPPFARVRDGGCSGCGSNLPISLATVSHGSDPSSCPSCRRILLSDKN